MRRLLHYRLILLHYRAVITLPGDYYIIGCNIRPTYVVTAQYGHRLLCSAHLRTKIKARQTDYGVTLL